MKKGIVMEVNKRFLTILTPEGEFLRTQNQNNAYQIGQEIDFIPIGQQEKKNPFDLLLKRKMVFSAAFAAVILFSLFYVPYYQSNQVYAYMSIDVNPSLEIAVNKDFQVLDITPYNEEAKRIVKQLSDWNKEDLQDVTDAIMAEIKKQGYMESKHHEVVISTVDVKGNKQDREKQWSKEIDEITNEMEKEKVQLTIVEGTKAEREKAKEKGLTTGLYKANKIEQKKENINKESSETKQKQTEQLNTPAEDIRKNEEKGQSEAAPGQQKKEEKNNNPEKNLGQTEPNNNQNKNSVQKENKDTWEEQNQNSNNEDKNKQKDKAINSNKNNKIDNKNTQHQEKQDKHNKD